MTFYALIKLGDGIMGVGETASDAILDAKLNHQSCRSLPDNPNNDTYAGSADGEYRIMLVLGDLWDYYLSEIYMHDHVESRMETKQ